MRAGGVPSFWRMIVFLISAGGRLEDRRRNSHVETRFAFARVCHGGNDHRLVVQRLAFVVVDTACGGVDSAIRSGSERAHEPSDTGPDRACRFSTVRIDSGAAGGAAHTADLGRHLRHLDR